MTIRTGYCLIALLATLLGHSPLIRAEQSGIPMEIIDFREATEFHLNLHSEGFVYQCAYNLPSQESPERALVVELDNSLYLKWQGQLIKLDQLSISESAVEYANPDNMIKLSYRVTRRFNFSEYRESDDREVNMRIDTPTSSKTLSLTGRGCGI